MAYVGEVVCVYPTYKKHKNAQRRDRPKHYPGGTIYADYMRRGDYAKVYRRVFNSQFRADDAARMSTAEYVATFCALNNLTK